MKLFAGLGIPLPEDARAPGQPDRHGAFPGQKEPVASAGQTPTVKPDTDKQANLLRERLKKERHDKQQREKEAREKEAREKQREAELKAAALAKEREAAIAEQMRQKRAVDVETARDAARKKISTMIPQKTQSPSVPPTPISSTPVLAATLRATAPHVPLAISIPPHPKIPGLFLTQNDGQQPDTQGARTDNDVVMTTVPASSTSSGTPGTAEPPSAALPNQPTTARRKRPVASDMYSEPNQVKRIAFGAKRTQSLIIEVSDDEDADAEQTTKERQTPPSLSRTVSEVGNVARRNNVPQNSTSNNAQSNALLQKEIELQQMKEKLKSMQERKRKNGTSAIPTPTVTPTVGAGPTVPPPLNAAAQSFTPQSAGQKPPGGSIGKEDNHVRKVVEEQVEANAVKEQKKKVQTLSNEREQLVKQVEEKKEQEKAQEDLKIQEEKEKKRKQMSEFDTSYKKKRKAMEALKAQMDRIQREQQEMEERKRLLAEELQALEHTKKVHEDVPNDVVEMESNQGRFP